MREILFRGQTRKRGEKVMMATGEKVPGHWVYGGIFPGTGDYSIIYGGEAEDELEKHVVYSETVGQYTGLHDATKWEELSEKEQREFLRNHRKEEWKGKRIFEGDVVHCISHFDSKKMVVTFENGEFVMVLCERYKEYVPGCGVYAIRCFDKKVIGNIHDNPELLEGGVD